MADWADAADGHSKAKGLWSVLQLYFYKRALFRRGESVGLTQGSVHCFRPTDLTFSAFPSLTCKAPEQDTLLDMGAVSLLLKQPVQPVTSEGKRGQDRNLTSRACQYAAARLRAGGCRQHFKVPSVSAGGENICNDPASTTALLTDTHQHRLWDRAAAK